MSQATLYVATRASDDMFVAIDTYSGGYPYFTEHLQQAEVFKGDSNAINQLLIISADTELVIHELTIQGGRSLDAFEQTVRDDVKNQALAKLTPAERRALGY